MMQIQTLITNVVKPFQDVDKHAPSHVLALGFVVVCWLLFSTMIICIALDLRTPIENVTAQEISGPTAPGGTAHIRVNYTRGFVPRLQVMERRLLCSNGVLYYPEALNTLGNGAWPVGNDVTADLFIRIPEAVPTLITCYYDSLIRYKRYLLPDLYVKIPPIAVKITIDKL